MLPEPNRHTMEELISRGNADGYKGPSGVLLTAPEAEQLVERIKSHSLAEVGTGSWLQQHSCLDKLNLQAHHNAQSHSDEFVMSALVSFDKVSVLIEDLLVFEVWTEKLLPLLAAHIAEMGDVVASHTVISHGAMVANLLEVVLYHQEACEAISDDALLELCDWCYRQLLFLNKDAAEIANTKERNVKDMMRQSKLEELHEKWQEQQFGTALSAVTIVRYLTDYLPKLQLGALSRLVSTNDTIMALLPLLDDPPWQRRRKRQLERYIHSRWVPVEPQDRLKLALPEAQVWLALHNLIVDPRCRAKYDLGDYRKDAILRLKRHMNEILFDQLPILKDLQRVLDEISLGMGAEDAEAQRSRLILEQVPAIRESLLKHSDWEQLAEQQRQAQFSTEALHEVSMKQAQEMLKTLDFMMEMQPDSIKADHGTQGRQEMAGVRVETWRRARGAVFEAWTELDCPLGTDKAPEAVQLTGEGETSLKGHRYRLKGMDADASRPLPSQGKIVAKHAGKVAEALLELPAAATRDEAAGLAPVIWLTVGLLAMDGFALQLRLKKAAKPKERDAVSGTWYCYHAVGGALTIADEPTTA